MLTIQTCTSLCFQFGLTVLTIGVEDSYYCSFPTDTWRQKSLVTLTYSLELAQMVMSTHDAFRVFASGFGNFLQLDSVGLYWVDVVIIIAMSK